MNTSNPRNLALLQSFFLTILSAVIYLAAENTFRPGWSIIVTAVLLFVIQYYLIKYFLQAFIYEKIKLIYKTIHNLKLSRGERKDPFEVTKGNVIENVSDEVAHWASAHERELDEMKHQEAYRREFLGNVSHELKTPLFNVQGYALTLLEGGLDDPSINKDYLQKLQNNIERMITIVSDLEVISRLESGEAKPQFGRFDMVNLTREVYEMLEPKARQKNISFIFGNDSSQPQFVWADKEKIRQVMVNLVENSLKYGKDNGRTKVSYYEMDENLLIEVSDNGLGIDDEHLPHLFERFYRVDRHRSRSDGGSGLGLAIVKHIIEAHEQTINVRSAPGVGSTFSFTLKIAG